MNAFFAMGTPPTIADDSPYFIWAAQNWMFLILPTLALIAMLVTWVVRGVRACMAGSSGGPGPTLSGSLDETMAGPDGPDATSGVEPEGQTLWAFFPPLRLRPSAR